MLPGNLYIRFDRGRFFRALRAFQNTTLLSSRVVTNGFLPLLLCLLYLSAAPAEAQLRFRQDTAHAALWRTLYNRLPSSWKAREWIYVREVSDNEMERYVVSFQHRSSQDNSVVDGWYQTTDGDGTSARIVLRETLRGEKAALVFLHEYGHYIWNRKMSVAQRRQYHLIWDQQKADASMITPYASESVEEGFAEAFAFFIRKSGLLKRVDSQSHRFITDLETDMAGAESDLGGSELKKGD